MTQKRFLTAAEVFQLFGVDADGLDRLIKSGDVTALPDRGTFKYRREDFAALVKKGKLVPRTSGELFKLDAKGDMPFLKLQNEDQGLKFGEKVEFLELDEEALEEQARIDQPVPRTPVVPEKWFDDSDDSAEIPELFAMSSQEIPSTGDPKSVDDATELEVDVSQNPNFFAESDSDVRIFADDADIDLDGQGEMSSGSDSDVRLVGPVSSTGSGQLRGKPAAPGDSEIRLVKKTKGTPQSDSDVTLLTNVIEPSAHFNAPSNAPLPPSVSAGKKPDSDSDVQLASPNKSTPVAKSAAKAAESTAAKAESDSDVVLVGLPTDIPPLIPIKSGKKPDSDSDVRLSNPSVSTVDSVNTADIVAETIPASPEELMTFDSKQVGNPALDFGDSNIRLEPAQPDLVSPSPAPVPPVPPVPSVTASVDDSSSPEIEIEVEGDAGDWELELENPEDGVSLDVTDMDLGTHVASIPNDSAITLENATSGEIPVLEPFEEDAGVSLDETFVEGAIAAPASGTDSDITMEFASSGEVPVLEPLEEGSGVSLEKTYVEAGMTSLTSEDDDGITLEIASSSEMPVLEAFDDDSGITLEPETGDSGITLEESDSGVRFESMGDSEISLGGHDSGISLEGGDSGISLEAGDSGISLTPADSVITLSNSDSGISLTAEDSGISLDAEDDLAGTFVDNDVLQFASDSDGMKQTAKFDSSSDSVRDSGFDVSLADEEDHTMELDSEGSDFDLSDAAATVAEKQPKRKSGKKSLDLSEAFQLDEPPEVEDLDISEDLDSAGDEYLEDFAAAEDEALDVSDEAFSAEGILADVDEDEEEHKAAVPAAQRKVVSSEPSWGLDAIILVGCSSLVMAATMTAVLGGIATMWTGEEVPGPVAMVVSNLAGLSPW